MRLQERETTQAERDQSRVKLAWRISKPTIELASVRYRALLPIIALLDESISSHIISRPDINALGSASHLVIVKCFSHADVDLVREARLRGIHTIFDLCDNIFVEGYGKGAKCLPVNILRSMSQFLDAIIVPTQELADVVKSELQFPRCVHVVPDGIEDQRVLERQRFLVCGDSVSYSSNFKPSSASGLGWGTFLDKFRARLRSGFVKRIRNVRSTHTILWFGNHGSPWSTFGISDILVFREALEKVARNYSVRLLVVSNNRSRFESEIRPLAIPSEYLEWTPELLYRVLREADIVIAPNSLDDFSRCKSANRSLMALNAGVPVVATPTSSLESLRGCVWLDDPYEGISLYLSNPSVKYEHIKRSRVLISKEYSTTAVAARWRSVLAELGGS